MKHSWAWIAGTLALTALATPAAATVAFTDSTFNLANYTVVGPYTSVGGISTSAVQCASCGNPGNALQVIATFSSDSSGFTAWGFANNSFTYDPAVQGTLAAVTASVDKNLSTTAVGSGFTNTFRPLILQGGNYYLAAISLPKITGPATTGYQTASGTLTASDFSLFDFLTGTFGSTHPDFSTGILKFGLGQISSSNGASTIEADYDNLSFGLAAVPEPSTWAMMLLGFGAIGLVMRRSKRRSGVPMQIA